MGCTLSLCFGGVQDVVKERQQLWLCWHVCMSGLSAPCSWIVSLLRPDTGHMHDSYMPVYGVQSVSKLSMPAAVMLLTRNCL